MSYSNNEDVANALNEHDALRIFILGLRLPLSHIIFSARPANLPTALATTQELESDRNARNFQKCL